MLTRRALLTEATDCLTAAGAEAPRKTAEWLLEEALGCSRAQLYAYADRPVPPAEADRVRAWADRRAEGEPLQHILGHTDFYGLRIHVSPAVLIPRPETEEVVEGALATLENAEAPRILDVGTGSGCIALALKHERPDAEVHACDVSADALGVARVNAERLGLDVSFHQADLTDDAFANRVPDDLDLLVSNPPYIPDDEASTLDPVVRDYDPSLALFAGEDALRFYRALARRAEGLLRPGGHLIAETHADYTDGVADVFRSAGLHNVTPHTDLAGRPRWVVGERDGGEKGWRDEGGEGERLGRE